MSGKRSVFIAGRVAPELKARLEAIHARHKTSDSDVVEACIDAFCTAVEEADAVRFPIVVLLSEKRLMAAEDPPTAGYSAARGPITNRTGRQTG